MKPSCIRLFVTLALASTASAQSFYKAPPLFSTAPSEKQSAYTVTRFGPVGMAVDLRQPAFTMHVGKIDPGSPAETAGLKQGQIIETINGQSLKDIDPRIQLGRILEAAEASDGVLAFAIRGQAAPVVVNIPVLGSYSETWPLNCPKSDKIVRTFADYLSRPDTPKGFADFGMLFLLSTGEERDVEPVRQWVHGLKNQKFNGYPWTIGYGGLALCEYYLRTGDPEALPIIQEWVDIAGRTEYLDGWAGRGGVTRISYGNGHLNAAGTHVVTFLLLAKQCGVKVDESLLQRTLVHFFRYAGRGLNPYGDDRPESSFVDNGKNGKLAFAMAAAASLTPDGENSIYAKARDHMAKTSFYTTTFMLHGHTGGGIGEIWRSAAMGLLHEKYPLQYREFMDHRKWHYDLSRQFNGSFAIVGGAQYDREEWGICYPISYTIPRKTLRITGAPPSKFSKSYALPERPWGTAADDVFVSLDPVAGRGIDVSQETLPRDSAKPLIDRLNSKELTDDEIRHHLHHPDYLIRNMVALNAAGLSCDYMFPKPGMRVRPELLREFCAHADPRVRNAGFRAATKSFDPADESSQQLFAMAIERLEDPEESWFVKDACLALVQLGGPDLIVPHVDLLLTTLGHSEQWLQEGSLMALLPVLSDERCYQKVLPPVGNVLQTTPRQSTTAGAIRRLRGILPQASDAVRDLALEIFGDAYIHYSGGDRWVGGQDLREHQSEMLERIAGTLASVPGGYDVLYQLAKKRRPHEPLPYSAIFLEADPEQFGPDLRDAIKPIIRDELIYQFIGNNRARLLADMKPVDNRNASVTNTVDRLVSLYQKIGVSEYNWRSFGPDLRNSEWSFFSFDPPEKQKFDVSPWRYREVTVPKGMESWYQTGFDPAKVGWKKGLPPFGQFKGELRTNGRHNAWNETPRSFWEKEVLLVHGSFDFPKLKPGHLYRLRVQTGQGVGAGDGFKVYVNGKPLVETKEGLGRRMGDVIRGGWITPEFLGEFTGGPVTIAATTFLRYGDRAIPQMPPVPQGIFSLWLEERALPTIDNEVLKKAATFVPMFTSEWQAGIDPESSEKPTDAGKFRYDGTVHPNPALHGAWITVAEVATADGFDPAAKPNPGRAPLRDLTFHDDGNTDKAAWIWSGDRLMNLETSTAHRIMTKKIGDTEYLFIESGGFSARNRAGWVSPLFVMRRD